MAVFLKYGLTGGIIALFLVGSTSSVWAQSGSIPESESVRPEFPAAEDTIEITGELAEFLHQGYLFLRQQNLDDAIRMFQLANVRAETDRAHYGLARAYHKKGTVKYKRGTPVRSVRRWQDLRKAEDYYHKAIALNPTSMQYRYDLAMMHLYKRQKDNLRLASEILEYIKDQTPAFSDVDRQLGIVYRLLNEPEKSQVALESFLSLQAKDALALFELTKLHINSENIDEGEKYYMEVLSNLEDPLAIREVLYDTKHIFSAQDQRQYDQARHKGRFLKKFWIHKDPTPATPGNERVKEHLRRISYARKNFKSASAQEEYDDRGRIHIKYGTPDDIYKSAGNLQVYSNVTWTYHWKIGKEVDGLYFDFANDPGFGYRLLTNLSEAIPLGGSAAQLQGLYQEREDMGWPYWRLAHSGFGIMDFYSNLHEMMTMRQTSYEQAPPEGYNFFTDVTPLPLNLAMASFRDENNLTRHELYYEIPYKALKFEKDGDIRSTPLHKRVVVRNLDAEILFNRLDTVVISYQKKDERDRQSYVAQINFFIDPREPDPLANLEVFNPPGKKFGLYFHDLTPRDYRGQSFMVSDVELAYSITNAVREDVFTKNGLQVIPHPSSAINKADPIYVYFEIYNLQLSPAGKSKYQIKLEMEKYTIDKSREMTFYDNFGNIIKPSRQNTSEFLSLTQTQDREGPDQFEFMAIDMEHLTDGNYNMTVTIADMSSDNSVTIRKQVQVQTVE